MRSGLPITKDSRKRRRIDTHSRGTRSTLNTQSIPITPTLLIFSEDSDNSDYSDTPLYKNTHGASIVMMLAPWALYRPLNEAITGSRKRG